MWLLPLLVISAIVVAAASRSPRAAASSPQTALPVSPQSALPMPGPIAVLGEIARIGRTPPPTVILCAIAEAESLGRGDITADIIRVFVAPRASAYARGSGSPRASCEPVKQLALPSPPSTDEELRALINADPERFMALLAQRQPVKLPVDEVTAVALAEQLIRLPGHVGAGIVLTDPSDPSSEIFEVRWLRGYAMPTLPATIDGRPTRLVIVDSLPSLQPTGLPPETVAQMQEDAGLPEAADQTRAIAPGSPIASIPDDAWRQFVIQLSREDPTYSSSRHVGQFRQRRERLIELGIDPGSVLGFASAQRVALDRDLADAYKHAIDGDLVDDHVGRKIQIPGQEDACITLSGLLGVIQCAGLDGATGWLEKAGDRKRFPHTTQAFQRTNGVF